jgi:hypothetical protein
MNIMSLVKKIGMTLLVVAAGFFLVRQFAPEQFKQFFRV